MTYLKIQQGSKADNTYESGTYKNEQKLCLHA